MQTDILIILSFFLSGFFFLRLISTEHLIFNSAIAIPIGMSFWLFSFLPLNILFEYNIDSSRKLVLMLLLYLVIIVLIIIYSVFKKKINKKELIYIGGFSILFSFITYVSGLLKPAILTNDSYNFLIFVYDKNEFLNSGKPAIALAMQSIALLTDFNHFFAHTGIINSISLFIIIAHLLYLNIEGNKTTFIIILFVIIPPLIFFSNFIVFFNVFYINTHITTAVYYLIPIYCLYQYLKTNNKKYFFLINYSLVVLIFLRTEGVILAPFFLLLFLNYKHIPLNLSIRTVLIHTIITTPWLIYVFINTINKTTFLNEYLILGIINLNVMVLLFFYIKKRINSFKIFMESYLSFLIFILFFLILSVFILLKPMHMKECFDALFSNLFYKYANNGGWGITWFIFTPFTLFLIWKTRIWASKEFIDILLFFFINAFFLTFLLSFFRAPLRASPIDSVNRMLVHFAPIFIIWVFIKTHNYAIKNLRK